MKHRSEKNYYNVFSYSPNGAAIHEIVYDSNKKPVNYRILDVNVAFEKILSLPKKQVIGKLATEAYQTDYAPYLNEYYQAADSKETPYKWKCILSRCVSISRSRVFLTGTYFCHCL